MFYRNEIRQGAAAPAKQRYSWKELEEYHPAGGMWSTAPLHSRADFIAASANLMRDPEAFFASMTRATAEWPKSAEQALTTPSLNQRAWLGYAGCYLATGSPEETTRLGWHELNDDEQRAANQAADDAIAAWHAHRYANSGQPPLFGAEHA